MSTGAYAGRALLQAGVALKPSTPAELVFPYIEAGLLDLVRHFGALTLRIQGGTLIQLASCSSWLGVWTQRCCRLSMAEPSVGTPRCSCVPCMTPPFEAPNHGLCVAWHRCWS
jgi:hypothetical protein